MAPRYTIGQKVIIMPLSDGTSSPRDSSLEPFTGKIGTISEYYWITKYGSAEVFYVYAVQIEENAKDIILHEDELKAYAV